MNLKALDTLITQAFGNSTASKGKAYWKQARARVLEVDEKHDVMQIRSMVRGSGFNFYEVQLSWAIDHPEMMQGMCSCPMGNDCKHCAATAYLYFSSQPDQRRENSIDTWLTGLRRQRSQAEQTETEDLVVYLLSFAANKQLDVTPVKVRKLKKGGYGQQRRIDLQELRGQYSRATSALDNEVGGLLAANINAVSYYSPTTSILLKGEVGALALKKILQSGRCHLQDKDSPELSLGSARQLDLEWHKGKNGWRLHTISKPPLERWFEVGGFWYYDSIEATIGQLQTEIEPATLMEILKIPAIPEDRLADVNRALLDTLPDIILPIPAELDLKVQTIQNLSPRPIITLRNQISDSGTPAYGVELEFEYNGIAISTAHKTSMLRVEQDGVLYQIYRQLELEKDLQKQLEATRLQVQKDNKTYLLPGRTPQNQAEAWEQWLSQSAPELEAQDWTIHVASDFSLNIYAGEQNWQATISESNQDDWFNLSLGIELNGRSINLLPMLVSALQQEESPEALLQRLERQPYLLLPIGKEEWVKLPSQRIYTIVATLIELYDREALSDNGDLELNWYQSLGLKTLLDNEDLVWQGADRLKTLIEKLRQFEGIEATPMPKGFGAILRPYQLEGYRWLQFLRDFGFHGILADDMGLGKTVQTLAHLLMEKQSGRADLPSLVIAPTSVVGNWVREASRFAPQLKVKLLHGSERKEELTALGNYDLLVTTYTLIRRDLEAYLEQTFHLLILDEAQMIKNPQAKTTLAISELKARHRLALSGTPMENHLAELWSIFHFLMPGFLNSQPRFTRLFRNPIEKEADQPRSEALRQRIKPFMLRRSKTQVERDLPAKTEIVHFLSLSGSQRDLYETLRVAMDARIKEEIGKKGLKRSQIMLLDALLKLRQVCCDPSLVKLDQARKVKESAKLDFLATILPELVAEGRKILIFSQFVAVLDLIETLLKKLSIPNLRLTGATRKREEVVDKFQRGEAPIFLISLKAGGVGLNLTAADTVIHYDPWWNPAAENQATDRAWRIGQDKPVFVYKLITEQTIEEKILALQAKKQQLTEGVFSEQEEGSLRIEAEELLALLEA